MFLLNDRCRYARTAVDGQDGVIATRLPLTDIPDETLRCMYAYWRSKRPPGMLPARADIDPADFPWALGLVCLLQVERETLSFRYRLDGSIVADDNGEDLTGRLTDAVRPVFFAGILHRHFSEVVRSHAPSLYEIAVRYQGEGRSYRRVAMPLATNGRDIDMIMTVSQRRPSALEHAGPWMR